MKKVLVYSLGIMMCAGISATTLNASALTTTHQMEMIKKDGGKKKKKDCCKDESKCEKSKKCKNGKGACCSDHKKS
jgi:hypothetical protein